jgi:YebC/PmpR family DNA-binding regulatory protein
MSGHSKWSTIKHKKAATDAKRGKLFTKLIKEITVAARFGGGDADANPRLRTAVDKGKGANLPKDTIERAIKKGTGDLDGISYEDVTYEGYGPGGVAVMLTCLTDNKNRTVAEVRHIFAKTNGNLGQDGCVGYLFEKKGQIVVERSAIPDMDDFEMAAIEGGAEDIDDSEAEAVSVSTSPEDFEAVRDALEEVTSELAFAEVTMVPSTMVELEGKEARGMVRLTGMLEDLDDVQDVYHNANLDEAAFEDAP